MKACYSLVIRRSAEKEIRDLPRTVRPRVVERIRGLAADPRPPGAEKLAGREAWRVRVGAYRIVYTVDDDALIVEIVRAAHRREVNR